MDRIKAVYIKGILKIEEFEHEIDTIEFKRKEIQKIFLFRSIINISNCQTNTQNIAKYATFLADNHRTNRIRA